MKFFKLKSVVDILFIALCPILIKFNCGFKDSLKNAYGNDFKNKVFQSELLNFLEKNGYTKDQTGFNNFIYDHSDNSPIFTLTSKIDSVKVHTNVMDNLYKKSLLTD